jgi:malic enzyme
VFNDDVQGTGAVVMAAVYSGLKVAGTAMAEQTLVVFGSGTAGVGIADQLRDAMIASTQRPMIFPISNLTEKIEAMPADVLDWSGGKALVATGIPVDPSSTTASPTRSVRPTTSWCSRDWVWVSSSPARNG